MDSLLGGADVFVAEIPGVDESSEPVLQSCPHTNPLTRAAAVIKMLPHLKVHTRYIKHTKNYIVYE